MLVRERQGVVKVSEWPFVTQVVVIESKRFAYGPFREVRHLVFLVDTGSAEIGFVQDLLTMSVRAEYVDHAYASRGE